MSLRYACLGFSLLACSIAAQAAPPSPAAPPSIERWDRVVCLVEERTDEAGKKSGDAGAAFLLADADALVLVTAGHVARFTTAKTRLLYRDSAGDSCRVILGGLTKATGEPWHYHGQADLAILPILSDAVEPEVFASLSTLAIPIEQVMTQVPVRGAAIEIVGFPMLLGVQPAISPLVMNGRVASRQLPLKAKWGHEQIVFTFPVVGHGCSGGPAFLSAEHPTDVEVMGMCIGYYQDKVGFKLSKVIPGQLIVDWVRQQAATTANQPE